LFDMAFSFHVDTEHGIVLFKGEGTFSSADALSCVEKVMADPAFQPRFNHLVDLRAVTAWEPRARDIRVRAMRNHDNARFDASRVAIVSSDDVVYGMARMYEILMSDASVHVRAFREMDEAAVWLKETGEKSGTTPSAPSL
jgi:hypothetical protein